jgi:hypothetical protein
MRRCAFVEHAVASAAQNDEVLRSVRAAAGATTNMMDVELGAAAAALATPAVAL